LIVEFVGLPGCGKSSVSHGVAERLRREQQLVSEKSFELAHRMGASRRRWRKGALAGRCILRRPRAALCLAREVVGSRQRSWLEGIAKALDLLAVCGLVADRARQPGIHLVDQGFFSGLWSICFRAASDLPLERVVAIGSDLCGRAPADLVIALDVEPATAAHRLTQRSGAGSRLQESLDAGVASPEMQRELQAAVDSLRQVRQQIAAPDRAWTLHVLPNDDDGTSDSRSAEVAELVRVARIAAKPAARTAHYSVA
jgi:broad-specificity NMP kinase